LRELGVAVALADVGSGEELLRRGEFRKRVLRPSGLVAQRSSDPTLPICREDCQEMHEITQKTFEMARNRALYFVLVQPDPVIPADLEWSLLDVPEACLQAR